MPNYLRARNPGGTFWFTVVTDRRAPILTTDVARTLLHEAIEACRADRPFRIDAFVLLPDHLHTIWTMPADDTDYSTRWSIIKRTFAQAWIDAGGNEQPISASKHEHRRLGVWQRRFYEHAVRADEFDVLAAYAHFNPVKHGHAQCPHAWPWSTFHRWVKDGRLPRDWRCVCDDRGDTPPPVFPDWIDSLE